MADGEFQTPDQQHEAMTVIGEDVDIRGGMRFDTSVLVKGSFEGEIASEGLLIVGPSAKINATIFTGGLVSHGETQGEVIAREQVVLKGTASHRGSITTPDMVLEGGCVLNGSCRMKKRRDEARTPASDGALEKVVD